MIEQLTKKNDVMELTDFFVSVFDYDFYITENNIRLYMTNKINIKKFLRQSSVVYFLKERGDYKGIVGVWKSKGGGKTRYYVKLAATDFSVGRNLLTALLWNFEKDLYIKIRKDSQFVSAFKNKGFRFNGGRGCQILLYRKYLKPRKPDREKLQKED